MNADHCISSRDKGRSHPTHSYSSGTYNVPGNLPSAGNPSGCTAGGRIIPPSVEFTRQSHSPV